MALTTGTGMGIKAKGNWLVTARASYGVLSYDNYNIGLSGMAGKKPDSMGYEIMDELKETLIGALDASFNHGRFEHKAEFNIGQKDKKDVLAGFYRMGINFLEENRLKLEGQYVYTEEDKTKDYYVGGGITFKFNSWLTGRIMYEWQHDMNEQRIIAQLYLYYFAL
jgi:hypothetical protein